MILSSIWKLVKYRMCVRIWPLRLILKACQPNLEILPSTLLHLRCPWSSQKFCRQQYVNVGGSKVGLVRVNLDLSSNEFWSWMLIYPQNLEERLISKKAKYCNDKMKDILCVALLNLQMWWVLDPINLSEIHQWTYSLVKSNEVF